jgi:hypothetical protein
MYVSQLLLDGCKSTIYFLKKYLKIKIFKNYKAHKDKNIEFLTSVISL